MGYDEDEDNDPQPEYTQPDAVKFVEDMEKAGLTVKHYYGRSMWEGPSVVVEALQDAMSETKVRVQYDNLGDQYVVYPVARDKGVWPYECRHEPKHMVHTHEEDVPPGPDRFDCDPACMVEGEDYSR